MIERISIMLRTGCWMAVLGIAGITVGIGCRSDRGAWLLTMEADTISSLDVGVRGDICAAGLANHNPFIVVVDQTGDLKLNVTWQDFLTYYDCLVVKMDGEGSIYMAGAFRLTVDLDPGEGMTEFTSVDDVDAFLLKTNSMGELEWAKTWDGLQLPEIYDGAPICQVDLEINENGDIYVAAWALKKFNSDGDLLWSRDLDAFIVELDEEGNIVALARERGISVAKLSQAGEIQWDVSLGSRNIRVASVDNMNNILFFADGKLVTYNPTSQRFFPTTVWQNGDAVTTDIAPISRESILICGSFSGPVEFLLPSGPCGYESDGDTDAFLCFIDSCEPKCVWTLVGPGITECSTVSIDPQSWVYAAGRFDERISVSFLGEERAVYSKSERGVFITKTRLADLAACKRNRQY